MVLGSLWAVENVLVRLLGGRRYPEHEYIHSAFRNVRYAIEIVKKRVERKS
jgi:hypothetical protein